MSNPELLFHKMVYYFIILANLDISLFEYISKLLTLSEFNSYLWYIKIFSSIVLSRD